MSLLPVSFLEVATVPFPFPFERTKFNMHLIKWWLLIKSVLYSRVLEEWGESSFG